MIARLSYHHNNFTIKKEVCQVENEYSAQNFRSKRIHHAIEISAQMFLRDGIESVKMTDIADECGIGVATLYRYFGTKTGITIAAMTHLWEDLKKMFGGVFESPVFKKQTGLKQCSDLMRMFIVLYEAHPAFMKLLGEFDLMIIRENVPKEKLVNYDKSIINFYPVFEAAYLTGLEDGSVREIENFQLFYVSFAHTFMELSKKLIQGELLPSDDFSIATKELETVIDAAVYFLKKE
ncbi:MAG: TetR/AcrR family transcriptional regulator [Ruminococcus sp.]|nr:TetR/AcrR family transcriptional regulator [Ruminococcus sp.]